MMSYCKTNTENKTKNKETRTHERSLQRRKIQNAEDVENM